MDFLRVCSFMCALIPLVLNYVTFIESGYVMVDLNSTAKTRLWTKVKLPNSCMSTVPLFQEDRLKVHCKFKESGYSEVNAIETEINDILKEIESEILRMDIKMAFIREYPERICHVKYVIDLSAHLDSLSTISPADCFNGMNRLEKLDLDRSNISHIPYGVFNNLTNLQHLLLSNNRISDLRAGIFDDLHSLKYLSLYGNRISVLPEGVFDKLSQLETLHLDNNNMADIGMRMFAKLEHLIYLSISNNVLSSTSGICRHLKQLRYLNLRNNRVSHLDMEFSQCGQLNYLDVSGNRISTLSLLQLYELGSIENTNLSRNDIASIEYPEEPLFAQIVQDILYGTSRVFQNLDLSRNRLRYLGVWFRLVVYMCHGCYVDLSYNNFTTLQINNDYYRVSPFKSTLSFTRIILNFLIFFTFGRYVSESSYLTSIDTSSLSRTVFEIIDFKICRV